MSLYELYEFIKKEHNQIKNRTLPEVRVRGERINILSATKKNP